MGDYLLDHDEERFKKGDCGLILKYNNYLADQLSLIHFFNVLNANMGQIKSTMVRPYYKCLNEVTNFSKAYSMAVRFSDIMPKNNRVQIWSAFMELNGLGTKQNYEKAFKGFEICSFDKNNEIVADKCALYFSYMNYKGLGTPIDTGKGRSLLINYAGKKNIGLGKGDRDFIVSCKDINYDFIIIIEYNIEKSRKNQKIPKKTRKIRHFYGVFWQFREKF